MHRIAGFLGLLTIATLVLPASKPSHAEDYPTRHVRIITAGAGTFADIIARHMAHRLSTMWGRAVIVENHPAAALTIGTNMVAHARPDGYTLLLADRSPLTTAPVLYKHLSYDPVRDLRPITLIARAPAILAVSSSIPVDTLRDFIAYARQQQEPILFASAGNGTMVHLAGALFGLLAHANIQAIQYRGGTESSMAVLRNEAKFTFGSMPATWPHVKAGHMKALAVASATRLPSLPDIPTCAEAGLPGMEAEQWTAMLVPAGTPDQIAVKLNHDIVAILHDPTFKEMLRTQGAEAAPGTPEELASFIASERSRLQDLVNKTHLSID